MDRENQIKMIKLGDINPGHNKYDGSTVYGVGGVAPTIAARDYKGAKLILFVLGTSTKAVKVNSDIHIMKMDCPQQ